MDSTDWVWMHNAETGGTARFPALAREGWEARGWVETEPPAADDGTGTPFGVADSPEDQGTVADTEPVTEPAAKPAKAEKNGKVSTDG